MPPKTVLRIERKSILLWDFQTGEETLQSNMTCQTTNPKGEKKPKEDIQYPDKPLNTWTMGVKMFIQDIET
jgi:hypothetical protein